MIVVDASVLIAHLVADDLHHERAVEMIDDSIDQTLAVSPLTLAEVLVEPARTGRLDDAHTALATLRVRTVELDAHSSTRLAVLRADTGLKLPDCCVLLAAQDAPADAILTLDKRLAAAAEGLGIAVA